MTHAISWFEIPVIEYDRAVEFYETVLDCEVDEYENESDEEMEGRYGMFRTEDDEVGGALAQMEHGYTPEDDDTPIPYTPTDDAGPMLYLSVAGDVEDALDAVEPAGGTVQVGKESTGEGSYFAIVTDTEGNRVGLLSTE